jgi:meso-butanediol dehydrogenase / (S,S)-butanediol dehydrogenase / diacetyl reductase
MGSIVQDKVIIITGAARGMGAAIARDLASEGGRVVVADVRKDDAEKIANSIRGAAGTAISTFVDVTDRGSVKQMVQKAVDEFGRLDTIFNNAGVAKVMPFMEIDDELWTHTMKVNGFGVLVCIQEAARQMMKQGHGGKIINTSSIGGKQGYPLFAHYNASKFAVGALTQAAARAFGEYKITVNCFAPGIVNTEMWQELDKEFIARGITSSSEEALDEYAKPVILGRYATPADIVGVTRFLASSQSDYITGQTIMVDGGMVLI